MQSFGARIVCIRLILLELCVRENKKEEEEEEERRKKEERKNKIEIFAIDFLDCEEK